MGSNSNKSWMFLSFDWDPSFLSRLRRTGLPALGEANMLGAVGGVGVPAREENPVIYLTYRNLGYE